MYDVTKDEWDRPALPCADKLSFGTRALGDAAAAYAVWQRGQESANLSAYKCRYCVSWHLGTTRDD